MLGYKLSLQYNDSYAFRDYPELTEYQKIHQEFVPDMSGTSHPGVRRCEKCGELLNKWEEPLMGLKIKRRKYDISFTYDCVPVVSERFKNVVGAEFLSGLIFTKLPNDPDFYAIQAKPVVKIDSERSQTRFEDQCPVCGRYETVVGPYVILKEGETLPTRGFARTDLEFASGDGKHPLLLCDLEAGRVLKNAGLKGLDLVEF